MDTLTPHSFLRDLKATMANEQEKLKTLKNQLAQDDAYEFVVMCRELEKMIEKFQERLEFKTVSS
jgi:hypothetical protein